MPNLIADWRDRPTHRRVWALAAPMILSNISVPLVALVDSTVVGHLPHAHQLGAVAVGASLYTFLAWAMGFLRMGSTGFAAQAAGRGDGAALRQIFAPGSAVGHGPGHSFRDAGRAVERGRVALHATVGGAGSAHPRILPHTAVRLAGGAGQLRAGGLVPRHPERLELRWRFC